MEKFDLPNLIKFVSKSLEKQHFLHIDFLLDWRRDCDLHHEGWTVKSLWCLNFGVIKQIEMCSGQIIATSHDLTPNSGLVREIPLFQGNLGLVKYYNLARCVSHVDL